MVIKINGYHLKWIAFGLFIFLFKMEIIAQDENLNNNFLVFSITSTNYLPIQIKTEGVKLLESQITPSAEIGISYSRNIINNWGAEFGVYYSQIGYNIFYNFYSERFDNPQEDILNNFNRLTVFDYRSSRLSLKLATFKDFKISNSTNIRFSSGINVDFCHAESVEGIHSYSNINNKDYNLFRMRLESFVPIDTHASFTGKIGLVKTFKNNYLTINLVGSYSPSLILNGVYEFSNINFESKGTIKLRPSYFGIEFNYALALKKKAPNKTYK